MTNSFWSQEVYGEIHLNKPEDVVFEEMEYEQEVECGGNLYNVYYCERYGRYYGFDA